jgi:hypothetical protein
MTNLLENGPRTWKKIAKIEINNLLYKQRCLISLRENELKLKIANNYNTIFKVLLNVLSIYCINWFNPHKNHIREMLLNSFSR